MTSLSPLLSKLIIGRCSAMERREERQLQPRGRKEEEEEEEEGETEISPVPAGGSPGELLI